MFRMTIMMIMFFWMTVNCFFVFLVDWTMQVAEKSVHERKSDQQGLRRSSEGGTS